LTALKKIKAFTLSELMVVLVLTAIVVGLAFSILNLVQKQMLGIQYNYATTTELHKLEQSLWIDFNTYNHIKYNANTNELLFKNEINSIRYIFQKEWVLKNNDTINIAIENKNFYLDGKNVNKGIIDAIELTQLEKSQNTSLFVYNKKDATYYMNNGF